MDVAEARGGLTGRAPPVALNSTGRAADATVMPRRAKPAMRIALAVLLLLAWVCGLLLALPAGS